MRIRTNITYVLKNLMLWHKALPTYREGDAVYIELRTSTPDMVGKREGRAIKVQAGVTNDVANVLLHEIIRRVKTKKWSK